MLGAPINELTISSFDRIREVCFLAYKLGGTACKRPLVILTKGRFFCY